MIKCRCGYPAISRLDLDEHVTAMAHVFDGRDHGEAEESENAR